jgi:hypothetical protein
MRSHARKMLESRCNLVKIVMIGNYTTYELHTARA